MTVHVAVYERGFLKAGPQIYNAGFSQISPSGTSQPILATAGNYGVFEFDLLGGVGTATIRTSSLGHGTDTRLMSEWGSYEVWL